MTTQTLASTLTAGAEITEVDTPDGPFYTVAKVNRKSILIYLDAEDPEAGTVRLPIRDTDTVLVRR